MSSFSESGSTSLLVRVKTGDDEAWRRLVRLYSPIVYGLCRRCDIQQEDAEDVAQEVFRSISKAVDRFRRGPENGSFRAWIWTITRNKIRDHIRGIAGRPGAIGGSHIQRRLVEVPDSVELNDDSFAQPTEEDEHQLLHASLDLIRGEFEPQTWMAFWRSTVDGHSTAEISDDTGMSKPAIRQAKYRVLRRLREEIGDPL